MKIQFENHEINGKKSFKTIWRGWFSGVNMIFIPLTVLAAFMSSPISNGGHTMNPFIMVILIPIITAIQDVFFAGVILLGLKIWPKINNQRIKTI